MSKLFVLDKNTWNNITVCKQIIKDKFQKFNFSKIQRNSENCYDSKLLQINQISALNNPEGVGMQ